MEKRVVIDGGLRLDKYLLTNTTFSRHKIQEMISEHLILVNNLPTKNSYTVKINDVITIEAVPSQKMYAEAEKQDLDIVYEDDDLLVVNKANGVVVHPAHGNESATLVNGLLYHADHLSNLNGSFRPGIVHRIDAYTTGLLVVAKTDEAHAFLAKQLENHQMHRKYIALVWGVIKEDTATIDAPIGRDPKNRKRMTVTNLRAKPAITHLKVLERYQNATLIECVLETGRTHQIRVHLDYIDHPVVNDPVYGHRHLINDSGQALHAKELGFIHPRTKEYMAFDSSLPTKMLTLIEAVKKD